ncbi:uncharacterized protein [Solanum tuberosum]|uniref:uncharacterized protein n=1 Tax=Solanum tuberosum TaxID=4113 RepID=UPI000739FFF8|nr:PREDICTED: uncharacterized protein LOC107057974 [Solanum tuberosum]
MGVRNPAVCCSRVQDPSNEQSSREQRRDQPRFRSKKLQDFFKYNKTLLVIAILIATATYQTVLSPPGGVWQDNYWPEGNNNTNNDVKMSSRRIAGQAVMGTNNPISYGLFLAFNSIGFFVSLHTINFLTVGFPLQLELHVSLVALIATCDTAMSAITPNRGISLFFLIFSSVFPILLPYITKLVRNYCKNLDSCQELQTVKLLQQHLSVYLFIFEVQSGYIEILQ